MVVRVCVCVSESLCVCRGETERATGANSLLQMSLWLESRDNDGHVNTGSMKTESLRLILDEVR